MTDLHYKTKSFLENTSIINLHNEIKYLKRVHQQQVRWKNTFKRKYIIEKKANIKLKQQRAKLVKLLKIDEELMSKLARDARNVEKLLQSYNRKTPQVYSNPRGQVAPTNIFKTKCQEENYTKCKII